MVLVDSEDITRVNYYCKMFRYNVLFQLSNLWYETNEIIRKKNKPYLSIYKEIVSNGFYM